MKSKENWLEEIVHDAREKIDARPQSRKSIYWEEKRKQIQKAIEEQKLIKK